MRSLRPSHIQKCSSSVLQIQHKTSFGPKTLCIQVFCKLGTGASPLHQFLCCHAVCYMCTGKLQVAVIFLFCINWLCKSAAYLTMLDPSKDVGFFPLVQTACFGEQWNSRERHQTFCSQISFFIRKTNTLKNSMCRNKKQESRHLPVRPEFSNIEENEIMYFIQNTAWNSMFLGLSRTF